MNLFWNNESIKESFIHITFWMKMNNKIKDFHSLKLNNISYFLINKFS